MVNLAPRKFIKSSGCYYIRIPKKRITAALKNNKEEIWIAILSEEESPQDDDLLKWIKNLA